MHRERGLTLIELSVTLAVLAICAAVGVPALRALVQQQRAFAAMGGLIAHLANARTAAITHNRPVVLCPFDQAGITCVQNADWSRGWMVFFDADSDRQPDRTDDVIAVEQPSAKSGLMVRTSTGRRHVRYLPDGRSAGTNTTFELCASDGRLLGKVIINNAGRVRTERPMDSVPCA
jgi:type IV fimbrial biogenesis protein FimT